MEGVGAGVVNNLEALLQGSFVRRSGIDPDSEEAAAFEQAVKLYGQIAPRSRYRRATRVFVPRTSGAESSSPANRGIVSVTIFCLR